MKINPEFFPIKELKGDNKSPKKHSKSEKTGKQEDRVTLSNDKIRLVIEENKSASDTKMLDFKKAEEEIDNLKEFFFFH